MGTPACTICSNSYGDFRLLSCFLIVFGIGLITIFLINIVGPAFVVLSPGTKKTYEEIENWPIRYKSELVLQYIQHFHCCFISIA